MAQNYEFVLLKAPKEVIMKTGENYEDYKIPTKLYFD